MNSGKKKAQGTTRSHATPPEISAVTCEPTGGGMCDLRVEFTFELASGEIIQGGNSSELGLKVSIGGMQIDQPVSSSVEQTQSGTWEHTQEFVRQNMNCGGEYDIKAELCYAIIQPLIVMNHENQPCDCGGGGSSSLSGGGLTS